MWEKLAGVFAFLTLVAEGILAGIKIAEQNNLDGAMFIVSLCVGGISGLGAFLIVVGQYDESPGWGCLVYLGSLVILPFATYLVFYCTSIIIFIINIVGTIVGIVGLGNGIVLIIFIIIIILILANCTWIFFF